MRPRTTRAGVAIAAVALLAVTTTQGLVAAQEPVVHAGTAAVGPPPAGVVGLGIDPAIGVALVEASTGQILLARGETVRRPVASAIKLVTALVVADAMPPGTAVSVGEEVRGVEGSSYGLRPGEVRSVEDLLAGLLLRSGNDAAVALAVAVAGTEEAFVDRMAATLADLGIDARPGSSSGLDDADALSAIELATVARAALTEPRIRGIVSVPLLDVDGIEIENRNLFLSDLEGATGLKTGFTSAAGFTLAASARRDGRELIAVVLGASDDLERRRVAARLLDHGFITTTPIRIDRSVSLRTTAGPVLFATDGTTLTLAEGAAVDIGWPRTLRPDDELAAVRLDVGGTDAGMVGVGRRDGRRLDGGPSLGRALADGAYAAMRPTGLAGAG